MKLESRLPSNFTRILLSIILLAKTKSSRMASSIAVMLLLQDAFVLIFFFVAFLSWFRWKPPLSDKDSMLPNSHTSWTWNFWSDFCWRTGTKIMITFQPPTASVSSVKMRLSFYSCTLRSESISVLSRARESPKSYLLMQLLELHSPHASAEHILVLMECLLRKRCVVAKVTWKDKSVIIFVIFTKIIQ